MKKILITALILTAMLGTSLTASAATKTMSDGTVFDAEYYAATYPDVAQALGTDEAALYQHYVSFGKAEGRKPHADNYVSQDTIDAANAKHKYYKNITAEQAAAADAVAKQIADSIMANKAYTTDLQRVNAAAVTVASYCSQIPYGSDAAKWYRSPYGVFVGGVYTCAGSTRALGRILDYMGYSWEHTNENKNSHQWCIVTMDGQKGFADGMGGFAGYGDMVSGMTINGMTIYFPS